MIIRRCLIGLIFLTLAGHGLAASKSDLVKEKRWEQQIVPELMIGEPEHLTSGGTRFLALYTPATSKPAHGGVILIHGTGVHPAWPEVIEPLRTSLPDHGWATLSLQMPILRNGAPMKDYLDVMPEAPARIQAGVDFLKARGIRNIVLIGHSLGDAQANVYLTNHPDPAVHAYIAIGMSNEFPKHYNNAAALARISVPMLNLYGSQDDKAVLSFVKLHGAKASKSNKNYSQLQVEGADHFFTNMQTTLIKVVDNWLKKNAITK
jgi:pimeloyl-ACP methyl ester carboxylesterase